ncbi:MAG: response regulator transcription factor [Clostridia bacterium]|nr:response regulator transcription factor [Clostridia bacterium]
MRLVMKKIIEKSGEYELVGEATNGEEMLELFEREHPQAVILDVEMPGMDGIQCARAIQDRAPLTVIVFATGHEQYMGSAFEVYAFDYLLKPFKVERALKTLALISMRLNGEKTPAVPKKPAAPRPAPERLMLRHKEGVSFIDLEDILLIQREDRMTVIYTEDGARYITSDSLSELEERLPAEVFFRSHKSYIVNINQIDSITPYGRWTYVIKLRGTQHDALITHERFEELEKLFA